MSNAWSYNHITHSNAQAFVKSNYSILSAAQIAKELNIAVHSVYSMAHSMGLKKCSPRYSKQDDQHVIDHYKLKGNTELAAELGRSPDSIKSRMVLLGLKRTRKQIRAIHKRINTGCFKKGHNPHNTRNNGTVELHTDGYYYIKHNNKIISYTRFLYENHYGAIPKNALVRINTTVNHWHEITPENLILISKADHCRLNYNKEKAQKSMLQLVWKDSYIAKQIVKHNPVLTVSDVINNQELISIKRLQILLNRKIKGNGN